MKHSPDAGPRPTSDTGPGVPPVDPAGWSGAASYTDGDLVRQQRVFLQSTPPRQDTIGGLGAGSTPRGFLGHGGSPGPARRRGDHELRDGPRGTGRRARRPGRRRSTRPCSRASTTVPACSICAAYPKRTMTGYSTRSASAGNPQGFGYRQGGLNGACRCHRRTHRLRQKHAGARAYRHGAGPLGGRAAPRADH
ncbi:hypothetical protein D9M72_379410 [compost metagenome]